MKPSIKLEDDIPITLEPGKTYCLSITDEIDNPKDFWNSLEHQLNELRVIHNISFLILPKGANLISIPKGAELEKPAENCLECVFHGKCSGPKWIQQPCSNFRKQSGPDCKPALTGQALRHSSGQAEAGESGALLRSIAEYTRSPLDKSDRKTLKEIAAHIDRLEAELKQQYDKGFLEGTEAQEEANRKHIIEPLAAEKKRLKEALAEEKRECAEGWRRWKLLRDKP